MANGGFPVLKKGDEDVEGNGVRRAQYLLRQRGFNIQPDHIFGPATEGAVKQFQQSENLLVDGIVGNQTWNALLVTVKKGSTGEAVKAVQSQFPAARNLSSNLRRFVRGSSVRRSQWSAC